MKLILNINMKSWRLRADISRRETLQRQRAQPMRLLSIAMSSIHTSQGVAGV